jgi:hypothetical protein
MALRIRPVAIGLLERHGVHIKSICTALQPRFGSYSDTRIRVTRTLARVSISGARTALAASIVRQRCSGGGRHAKLRARNTRPRKTVYTGIARGYREQVRRNVK